eukprot:10062533-Alexandrium_andersonii.AAC.1
MAGAASQSGLRFGVCVSESLFCACCSTAAFTSFEGCPGTSLCLDFAQFNTAGVCVASTGRRLMHNSKRITALRAVCSTCKQFRAFSI